VAKKYPIQLENTQKEAGRIKTDLGCKIPGPDLDLMIL
jgi:hypothetical protein